MFVEFIGIPGSGKSTLLPVLHKKMKEKSGNVLIFHEALYRSLRNLNGAGMLNLCMKILPFSAGKFLSGPAYTRSRRRFESLQSFITDHTDFVSASLLLFKKLGIGEEEKERLLGWMLDMWAQYRLIQGYRGYRGAVVVDEGFVHRTVSLFVHGTNKYSEYDVEYYINFIPLPAFVIYVSADRDRCLQRITGRGLPKLYRTRHTSEIHDVLSHADVLIQSMIPYLETAGCKVLRIENNGNMEDAVMQIENASEFIIEGMQSVNRERA